MGKKEIITEVYTKIAWMIDELDQGSLTDEEFAEAVAEACLTYASVYAAMYDISEASLGGVFHKVRKCSYSVVQAHQDATDGTTN